MIDAGRGGVIGEAGQVGVKQGASSHCSQYSKLSFD